MHKEKALQIIAENKKSYNIIASDFDITRQAAWPEFDILKQYIKEGDGILDIGCGNGRLYKYLITNYELLITNYAGVDQSEELIRIAEKMQNAECRMQNCVKADFKVADVFNLPFEDGEFDVAAGIAFLHHIPSEELRRKVLKEIHRVLKPGGILFLTNWNLWQWKLIKKYKLRIRDFFFSHKGLDAGDFWIHFRKKPRYYHHFGKREFFDLCKKTDFKILGYRKGKNNVIILQK